MSNKTTGDKQLKQYRAILKGTYTRRLEHQNINRGDPYTQIVGPYATIGAVRAGIKRSTKRWPFNHNVRFDDFELQSAVLIWLEVK